MLVLPQKEGNKGVEVCLSIHKTQKGRISATFKAWCGAGLNRRHMDFQSIALPTELPHRLPLFVLGWQK
jgi:hypothetical protein